MASHYLFEPEFCNPASGWEKGQVEKNVQDARRRLWQAMPVPIISQLLKAEVAEREVRSIAYQIKAAKFPAYKDLAGFDFASGEVNEAMVASSIAASSLMGLTMSC
jgi:hypothetical protein